MKRSLTLILCFVLVAVVLCACGEDPHTHTFAGTWSSDATSHWHAATCEHADEKADVAAHIDENNDGVCDICEYSGCFHPISSDWSSDETNHWHAPTCGHSVPNEDVAAHIDTVFDGKCDVCDYAMYNVYTVTIDAENYVTVGGDLKAKEGEDITFTLTIHESAIINGVDGATLVGEPVKDGENYTYTYKVEAISQDITLVVDSDKLSAATIIASGAAAIEGVTGTWKYYRGTLTLNIPAPGTYTLFALEADTQVKFSGAEGAAYKAEYTFTVDAAGEYTFLTSCNPDSPLADSTCDFLYVLMETAEEVTLPRLEGTGYTMPTNKFTTVNVVIPTPGFYQLFSTCPELIIGNEVEVNGIITNSYIFTTTEENQVVSFTVKIMSESEVTFEFDWEITLLTPVDLSTGVNELTLEPGKYYGFTYTVVDAGAQLFDLSWATGTTYLWNTSYKYLAPQGADYSTANLTVGTTVTFYVMITNETGEAEAGTITAGYSHYVPSKNGAGNYIAHASTEGIKNFYEYQDDESEVQFSVLGDGLISLDGGLTWSTVASINLTQGNQVLYLVKSENATEVEVKVEKISYEGNMTIGEDNVLSLVPGKEYSVTLDGFTTSDANKQFILVFSDPNLTIKFGNVVVVSGNTYSSTSSFTLSVIYNGTGTDPVDVTIKAKEPKTASFQGNLVMGNNNVNGSSISWNAIPNMSGNMTIYVPFIMMNANITYSVNGGAPVSIAQATEYVVALNAGDEIIISSTGNGYATVQTSYTVTEEGDEPENPGEGGGETPSTPVEDGSFENPFIIDSLDTTVTANADASNKYNYIFVAPGTGVLTVTYPTANSWIEFSEKDNVANSTSAQEKIANYFAIEAGKTYIIALGVWDMEAVDPVITFSFEEGAELPGEGGDDPEIPVDPEEPEYEWLLWEENTVTITEEQIASGSAFYNWQPSNIGEYTFTCDGLVVTVKDAEGNVIGSGTVTLDSYSVYLLEVNLTGATAGDYNLNIQYHAPEGAQENPISAELGNINLNHSGNYSTVWYSIVATENGTLTITADGNYTILLTAVFGHEVSSEGSVSLGVTAGRTYYFGVYSDDAAEIALNIAFEAGEVEGEGTKNLPYDLPLAEFEVNIPAWGDAVVYMYVATENGTLVVTTTGSNYDFYMSTDVSYVGYNTEESTLSLDVKVGDIVYITIGAADMMEEANLPFTVSFTAGEVGGDEEPEEPTSVTVNLGFYNNALSIEANTYLYAELYAMAPGSFYIVWSDETLVVTVDGREVENGTLLEITNPRQPLLLTIASPDYVAVESFILGFEEYVAPAESVVLGETTIVVEDANNGTAVEFTAPATGTYTVLPGVNAVVVYDYTNYFEGNKLTMELTEGQVVSLVVLTHDFNPGEVVITIVEGDGSNVGGDEGEEPKPEEPAYDYNTIIVEQIVEGVAQSTTLYFSPDEVAAGTANRVAAILTPGVYKFASNELLISAVTAADGTVLTREAGRYTIKEAGQYTISVSMTSPYGAVSANHAYTLTLSHTELVVEEPEEGGEGVSGTVVYLSEKHGSGRVLQVTIDTEAGVMTIVRSDLTGSLTAGTSTTTYSYSFANGVVTASFLSGTACTCEFDANGAPSKITWGSAIFTGFTAQA